MPVTLVVIRLGRIDDGAYENIDIHGKLFRTQPYARLSAIIIVTRGSAVTEGPRDVPRQLKFLLTKFRAA